MKDYNPEDLIHKYVNNTCSDEERAVVESWHLKDLDQSTYLPSKENISKVHIRTWKNISLHKSLIEDSRKFKRLRPRIAIAASLFFAISLVLYLYSSRIKTIDLQPTISTQNDVEPGGNKAILTLGDGKKILLHNDIPGLVAIQNQTSINKDKSGKLIYNSQPQTKSLAVMNKLETPRGGNYQIVLTDGTKVWLNAATILSYPTVFENNERKVYLKGEAYFEVAKDKKKQFKVITDNQTVNVLGTHFNINAYPDEQQIQTTLLKGSIKLFKGSVNKLLKPGQVALTKNNSENIRIEPADIEKNTAWINNEFIFNGENLFEIMKILSRWYDVEVIYQDTPAPTRYWGAISRSKNISEVLKMLQSTGKINFKIQERRITLMN